MVNIIKSTKCFQEHEITNSHKMAKTYEMTLPKCVDVSEMLVEG